MIDAMFRSIGYHIGTMLFYAILVALIVWLASVALKRRKK